MDQNKPDLHHPDLHHPDVHHEEHPLPKMGKRMPQAAQLTIVAIAAGLVAAAFIGMPAIVHAIVPVEAPKAEAPSQVENGAFKVTDKQWATLKVIAVNTVVFQDAAETDGRIALNDDFTTPVFSPYSGRVTRLIARAGDIVAKGDPLFAIQAGELAQAQNDLITAVASLKTTKAQLALATTAEKRQHELYLAQGAALKDWQQSQVDLATAQGGYNGAMIALSAVRSRMRILGKTDKEIDAFEVSPDILKLSADTIVPAPIGGTIVSRQISLGQNIVSAAAGASTPVFQIGDVSKVWLVANAREQSAPFLHTGDQVEVSVYANPSKVYKAKLAYVSASLDPNTHRLPVRAEIDNTDGDLKPEMMASFRILTGAGAANPGIPESAIVYEGEQAHVWVADDKTKKLELREIKAGRIYNGFVEATAGIKAGEKVVTSGAVFIDRAVNGD